LKPIQSKIDEK
jgi:hypothetical protein